MITPHLQAQVDELIQSKTPEEIRYLASEAGAFGLSQKGTSRSQWEGIGKTLSPEKVIAQHKQRALGIKLTAQRIQSPLAREAYLAVVASKRKAVATATRLEFLAALALEQKGNA